MPSCLSGIFPFSSSLLGIAGSTPRIRNSSHGGYYSRNPFAAESAFEKVSLELLLLFRQEVVLDVGAEQFVSRASFRHRLSPPQTTLPRCLFRPSLHRSEKSGENIQPLRANNNRSEGGVALWVLLRMDFKGRTPPVLTNLTEVRC